MIWTFIKLCDAVTIVISHQVLYKPGYKYMLTTCSNVILHVENLQYFTCHLS